MFRSAALLRLNPVLSSVPQPACGSLPSPPRNRRPTSGLIIARGTAQLPIMFTAEDPSRPWGGISLYDFAPSPSHFVHVLIEHAGSGVSAGNVWIDSSRVRQIRGSAVNFNRFAANSRLVHTVIDTAAIDGGSAVFLDRGRFEESTIRGSGGIGLEVYRVGPVDLLGGRIEGSAGYGLRGQPTHQIAIGEARPIRITGGRAGAVAAHLNLIAAVWPTPADQDSLLGNASDHVEAWHSLDQGELTLSPKLRWRLFNHNSATGEAVIGPSATLRIERGTDLSGSGIDVAGRLIAEGTATAPITLTRLLLTGARRDTTRLTHLRIVRSDELAGLPQIAVEPARTVFIDSLHAGDSTSVTIRSSGSRLANSMFQRALSIHGADPRVAALTLGAPGIIVENTAFRDTRGVAVRMEGGPIILRNCEISGSSSDGVQVSTHAVGVKITNCNIEQNAGAGVSSTSQSPVDAMQNWWGDPAGPLGPAGDGIAGNVEYSGHLPARIAHGWRMTGFRTQRSEAAGLHGRIYSRESPTPPLLQTAQRIDRT